MEQNIIENLISIGLTEGEAKVYLAMLSLGSSTVGPIVEESQVSASKVYQIIDRLIQKGLASMMVEEGTKLFSAADPKMIIDYLNQEKSRIDESKNKIHALLPVLRIKKGSSEKEPLIETLRGKKGFETAYSEMIESAQTKSIYLGIGGKVMSYKLQSLWYPYALKLQEKKIIHRVIYEDYVWYYKDPKVHRRKERKNFYPTVLPKKYHDLPNILILGNKAIITGVDQNDEIFSLIIRNKELTQSIYKMLNMIGDLAYIPKGYLKYKE